MRPLNVSNSSVAPTLAGRVIITLPECVFIRYEPFASRFPS